MHDTGFNRFVEITKRLRKECPWDREQTHESIRHSLIEETYETVESIDAKDYTELRNELGDILLHVVFHANIAEENGEFTLEDVIRAISDKMIRRHPHIYGNEKAENAEEVLGAWEKVKMAEGRKSLLDGIPRELPALLRAQRLTERAATVGFDWAKKEDAWEKVEEETRELGEVVQMGDAGAIEDEFGDLLFALVNYGRFLKVNPEMALRRTLEKFIARFRYIEDRLKEQGTDIHASNLAEMDRLWNEAKEKGIA
jgi:tetrapyrrole methylase family protein / MazG family protein